MKVDTSNWFEFNVSDIFNITGTTTTPKNSLVLEDGNKFPYITTAGTNNGVFGYSDIYTENGNVLTVDSAVLGSVFYQKDNFTASDHVEKLIPKFRMTKNIALFLTSILNKTAELYGYAYNEKRSQTALKNEKIKLPARVRKTFNINVLAEMMGGDVDMATIDTSSWKEFKLTDLFDIKLAKVDLQAKLLDDGAIPLISSGLTNNGICKYVSEQEEAELFKAGVITVDMFGKCFYQIQDFYAVSHGRVNILVPKIKVSKELGLYIAKIIENTVFEKSSFSSMCSSKVLQGLSIKLPITETLEPDYEYMENYMKEVEIAVSDTLTRLQEVWVNKHPLDIKEWKAFKYEDLFELQKVSSKLDKISLDIDGKTPVYSSETSNNGIVGYTGEKPDFIVDKNTPMYLVFGDHTRSMNIATESFSVMDNVKVLKPKCHNKNALFFISTIWKKGIKDLGYSRHWSIAKETDIYLPITRDGVPDFEYMAEYIEKINGGAENALMALISATC